MKLTIGSQVYPWHQYYQRRHENVSDRLDETLAQVAEAGLDSWEQIVETDADADRLGPLLEKHGLSYPSSYVGATLHEEPWREQAQHVLNAARCAKRLGASIVVCNPNPIDWQGDADKDDRQLRTQAEALRWLTDAMADEGLTLAYHTHDAEMRNAARELHHMMLATVARDGEGREMKLCCDAHWLFRGAGHSNVAFADLMQLYGHRIASLHLRQSQDGVWTESLDQGDDLDYLPLVDTLRSLDFEGPAIIETAFEAGTPLELDMVESHKRSATWILARFLA